MQGERGWIGALASAVMATALANAPASAQDLGQLLDGTWVIQRVERRDENARWVVQPTPRIGLLMYRIVGPLGATGAGVVNPPTATRPSSTPAGDPRPTRSPDVPDTSSAERPRDDRTMTLYLDDGRVRVTWIKSREVR